MKTLPCAAKGNEIEIYVVFVQSCVDGLQYSMNSGDFEKVSNFQFPIIS